MNAKILSETLLHSTILIECTDGVHISCGTGFFFLFSTKDPKHKIPVIVTNKHVVQGATKGKLIFHLCNDEKKYIPGKKFEYHIEHFEQAWILHPDKNVDLCVFQLSMFYEEYKPSVGDIYAKYLTEDYILNENDLANISHIEDVTIVGYPDGLSDTKNNLPLVRRGITASSLHYDFNGSSTFLIDAAIFPGSSGSPVYLYNTGTFPVKLAGINYAVANHTIIGKVISDNSSISKNIEIRIPNGLGVAIHARKLLDFKEIL